MPKSARILVIKHSAFGDFILSTGSFKAIRTHHRDDHVTLLTTEAFRALGEACPWFDKVALDQRPRWSLPWAWAAQVAWLRRSRFDRIYDLQRNDRTAGYFHALWPQPPEWVGVVRGCSHRYIKPTDRKLHIVDREVAQLATAGVVAEAAPDISWLGKETVPPVDAGRAVLLVPGSAPHRPEKRWPAAAYAALAASLSERGMTPVLIGGAGEAEALATIAKACPSAIDLGGQTSIEQIAALARHAAAAVGNDTGPMHVIAAAGCPAVSLFGSASDPALIAPRGANVTVLQSDSLADLPVARVAELLPG